MTHKRVLNPKRRPSAVTAEEASFLLWLGESPEQVAIILGVSIDSVARACYVAGDHETGAAFDRIRGRLRRGTAAEAA